MIWVQFELQLFIYANNNSLALFSTKSDEAHENPHLYYRKMGLST